ncbi:MAG: ATP-binding protein [Pseudomonadota bacterium]
MKQLFPAGKPVSGSMLIGRRELLDELENILAIGQSVILAAPRRYGKTSIALEILERFKREGYFISSIDIFDMTDKRYLAEKIIESCLKNNPVRIEKYWKSLKSGALSVLSMLKFKPSNEDIEVMLQLGKPSTDEEKLIDDALDFADRFCSRHKKNMVMFIDEFQEIAKIGGDALLKKMRSKFQRHKNIVYIFAGSQESLMTDLFKSKKHAFYRFGRFFEISNILSDDFFPYILKSFKSVGIKIATASIDQILEITVGHPYYTQLLCQMIYINCLKSKKEIVENDGITLAQEQIIEHELSFFDEIWGEIGNKKFARNILSLVAQGVSPYSILGTTKENLARILADLVQYGYISKQKSGKNILYDFKDHFFKKYVLLKLEE